jgi:glucose/arabinose dehydrogenase
MRSLALVALLAACGGKDNATTDAAGDDDAAPDGPPVLPACATPVSGTNIRFKLVVDTPGDAALLVTSPPADPRRFVVMQSGLIHILGDDDKLLATPFLDLSPSILSGGERGLLGLAFHPQYATNRLFFVYYTRARLSGEDSAFTSRDVVARCETMSGDPNQALASSCVEMLAIKDQFSNHNGGMIEFGKDGFLYIGTGDAGSAGDPNGNAQALVDDEPNSVIALMGKMLRIDVDNKDSGKEYGIPADNPFAGGGGLGEIFAIGLRNPWRWSFDTNGDIWIGDVGQNALEEVDYVPAGQLKGKNFGWNMWEADACFNPPCDMTGMTFPQDIRSHGAPDGYTSLTGGGVYRGTCYPDIVGTYFYADNTGRQFATAKLVGGTPTFQNLTAPGGETYPNNVSSIHADSRGELYVTTNIATGAPDGAVYHLEAGP